MPHAGTSTVMKTRIAIAKDESRKGNKFIAQSVDNLFPTARDPSTLSLTFWHKHKHTPKYLCSD